VWTFDTRSWDVASGRPVGGTLGRTLTRAEWENALPQRECAPAC
jgi:hypothetical protein